MLDRTDAAQGHPFNEQAALEELERLQAAIEQARRQRGQTVDEFDAFVRSFRNPPPADSVAPPPAVREPVAPVAVAPSPAALPPVVDEPLPVAPRPSPAAEEPAPVVPRRSIFDEEDDSPIVSRHSADTNDSSLPAPHHSPIDIASSSSVRSQGKRVGFATLIGGLAAVAVVVIGTVMLLNRGGQDAPPQATQTPAPAVETPAAPARTEPARPAVPVSGLQAEIVTMRPVWVRVLVDGEKTIERELRANDRVPLRAQRVIFLRAGDAGALRVVVNGQDQGVLGRDGEIVTRSFTTANR